MENEIQVVDDRDVHTLADVPLIPVRYKAWALVKGGFVTAVKHSTDFLRHPFGDEADGHRVLDVTGVPCAEGYMADEKGNVGPSHGRVDPLLAGESAYHDRSAAPAPPTAVTAVALSTSEPHPLMLAPPGAPNQPQE